MAQLCVILIVKYTLVLQLSVYDRRYTVQIKLQVYTVQHVH